MPNTCVLPPWRVEVSGWESQYVERRTSMHKVGRMRKRCCPAIFYGGCSIRFFRITLRGSWLCSFRSLQIPLARNRSAVHLARKRPDRIRGLRVDYTKSRLSSSPSSAAMSSQADGVHEPSFGGRRVSDSVGHAARVQPPGGRGPNAGSVGDAACSARTWRGSWIGWRRPSGE
jgi:hypothetical protein